jgi:hypothetical protein
MLSRKETLMRRLLPAIAVIALALASAPALAQEAQADGDALVAAFARSGATPVALDGVTLAGPVRVLPKPPADIPPTLHEQIRHLMARLDNAYPDASDARKLHFIADYLGINFRRLWNAYHPDRDRPDVDVRPADRTPTDRARPVDVRPDRDRPDRVRPDTRPVRPVVARPTAVRPAPIVRPKPRG